MIRTIRSGKVVEKSQFYVGERRPRAPKKKGGTSAKAKDKNMNTAARVLARTINCNFTQGDLWLTLTYDPRLLPADAEGAKKCCELFWRRLSRALPAGVKLRGFWIRADKDPETGEPERLHHHVLISAEGVEVQIDEKNVTCRIGGRDLEDIWGLGTMDVELLRAQEDFTPIAVYCVRQAVEDPNGKKWHPSRGLKKPVVESERVCAYAHELRAPAGATVSEIGHYDETSGTHYIRYIRKPKPKKVGGHKEPLLYSSGYVETDEMRWSLE